LRARTYSGPSPKASTTRTGLGHCLHSSPKSLQVSVETCQFPPQAAFWSLSLPCLLVKTGGWVRPSQLRRMGLGMGAKSRDTAGRGPGGGAGQRRA